MLALADIDEVSQLRSGDAGRAREVPCGAVAGLDVDGVDPEFFALDDTVSRQHGGGDDGRTDHTSRHDAEDAPEQRGSGHVEEGIHR